MPIYSYRAIDEEGKEIRGSLEALDLATAKKAVEDLHLEVLEVSDATRAKQDPSQSKSVERSASQSYAFEGTDAAGTVRRGTIQAISKREAFNKLRADQKLNVSMLSPMGTLPRYNDQELANWQKSTKTVTVIPQSVKENTPLKTVSEQREKPKSAIGFTGSPLPLEKKYAASPDSGTTTTKPMSEYHGLAATLRLYAGWLLAWYSIFVVIGYYAFVRALPWDIPFVQAFFVSPLIFSFIIAIFLFLMLSDIQKLLKGRLITGTILTAVGGGLFMYARILLSS